MDRSISSFVQTGLGGLSTTAREPSPSATKDSTTRDTRDPSARVQPAKLTTQSDSPSIEHFLGRERDSTSDRQIDRTDSIDSYRSQFRRRTGTGWSTNASIMTDITEPSSPETGTFQDEPSTFGDAGLASPRHFSLPTRSATLQSCSPPRAPCPSDHDRPPRTPRHGSSADGSHPTLRHRRLEEMASLPRRQSAGKGPGSGGFHLGPVPASSRRGSTKPDASAPLDVAGAAEDTSQPKPEDSRSPTRLETPRRPSLPAAWVKKEAGEGPSLTMGPVETIREETEPLSASKEEPPASLHASVTSHQSDDRVDVDAAAAPPTDDGLVQDMCNTMVKHAFGLEPEELVHMGVSTAAYESVRYCLDELSHILAAANLAGFDPSDYGIVSAAPGYRSAPAQSGNGRAVGAGGRGAGGGGGGSGPTKRPGGAQDRNYSGGGDGDGDQGAGGPPKRQKVSDPQAPSPNGVDLHLSCPFRKRNPVRFNVRDHQSCAVQSFPDIPQLKRHVKNFHKLRVTSFLTCQRCKATMKTKEALDEHVSAPGERYCTFRSTFPDLTPSSDPEDGINSQIEDILNGRKANSKVDSWDALWRTLFPGDTRVPESDFVPPIELEEVHAEFLSGSWLDRLRERIRERELESNRLRRMTEEDLNQWVLLIAEEADCVFSRCRAKKLEGLVDRPRRKRVTSAATAAQQTPAPTARTERKLLTPPKMVLRNQGSGESLASSIDTAASDLSWADIDPSSILTSQDDPTMFLSLAGNSDFQEVIASSTMPSLLPNEVAVAGPVDAGLGTTTLTIPPPVHIPGGPIQAGQVSDQSPVGSDLGGQLHHHRGDSGVDINAIYLQQRGMASNQFYTPVAAQDFRPQANPGYQSPLYGPMHTGVMAHRLFRMPVQPAQMMPSPTAGPAVMTSRAQLQTSLFPSNFVPSPTGNNGFEGYSPHN